MNENTKKKEINLDTNEHMRFPLQIPQGKV